MIKENEIFDKTNNRTYDKSKSMVQEVGIDKTQMNMQELKALQQKALNLYSLENYRPKSIDKSNLEELGLDFENEGNCQKVLQEMNIGIDYLKESIKNHQLYPNPKVYLQDIDLDSDLLIHNYTGACPTLTYEISPVEGCFVGCLYCLVTDGNHGRDIVVYKNYRQLVDRFLEEHYREEHYYYFSAKTEAFQEATLQTGVAHDILRSFIQHYKKFPESKARLFIASKAGLQHLMVEDQGETILDLLEQLKGKVQFNTSLSIMPDQLRQVLEPFSAEMESRLDAVKACRSRGIMANSALVQPILPFYLDEENMRAFFTKLKDAGIINFKPEFLTANIENIAMIGRSLGYFDPEWEEALYKDYLTEDNLDHLKQRRRMAPHRQLSMKLMEQLVEIGKEYNISTSICYWVREQLEIEESFIPIINEHGFQCLGYQRNLFA